MRRILLLLPLLLLSAPAFAQVVIPTEYRLSRTTTAPAGMPAVAPVTVTFLRTAASCGLAAGTGPVNSVRWDDPAAANPAATDCQWIDTAGATIVRPAPGYTHSWTLAARVGTDPWSQESAPFGFRAPVIPGVPTGLEVTVPPVQTASGVVRERFRMGDVDVAGGPLDGLGIRFLFGIPGTLPVTQGQHFAIAVW